MATYKREKRPGVPAGERAQCESCGRPATYLVNSLLWQIKEHDICPDCDPNNREMIRGEIGKEIVRT